MADRALGRGDPLRVVVGRLRGDRREALEARDVVAEVGAVGLRGGGARQRGEHRVAHQEPALRDHPRAPIEHDRLRVSPAHGEVLGDRTPLGGVGRLPGALLAQDEVVRPEQIAHVAIAGVRPDEQVVIVVVVGERDRARIARARLDRLDRQDLRVRHRPERAVAPEPVLAAEARRERLGERLLRVGPRPEGVELVQARLHAAHVEHYFLVGVGRVVAADLEARRAHRIRRALRLGARHARGIGRIRARRDLGAVRDPVVISVERVRRLERGAEAGDECGVAQGARQRGVEPGGDLGAVGVARRRHGVARLAVDRRRRAPHARGGLRVGHAEGRRAGRLRERHGRGRGERRAEGDGAE